MRLLEENMKEKVHGVNLQWHFWVRQSSGNESKQKPDHFKITFCISKTYNQQKKVAYRMGEHCKAYIWQKITSIIYKEVQVNNKKHKKRLKSRHFSKDKWLIST